MAISLSEVKETFYLSERSPSYLKWNVDKWGGRNLHILNVTKDSDCASRCNGYWVVKHRYKTLQCHRLVYMLYNNVELPDNCEIDHIDGDTSNNTPSNLRCVAHTLNSRNRKLRVDSSTGVTGVNLYNNMGRLYVRAHWVEGGKQRYKMYAVSKYGFEEALRLAVKFREDQIARLNLNGDGYTDRHGK